MTDILAHTGHPCQRPDCESASRWVLIDPEARPSTGPGKGHDGIRVIRTPYRVLVGVVSRTFGADRFDSEAEAVAFRYETLATAGELPEDPVGIDVLVRSVPTPWGTHHRTRRQATR